MLLQLLNMSNISQRENGTLSWSTRSLLPMNTSARFQLRQRIIQLQITNTMHLGRSKAQDTIN